MLWHSFPASDTFSLLAAALDPPSVQTQLVSSLIPRFVPELRCCTNLAVHSGWPHALFLNEGICRGPQSCLAMGDREALFRIAQMNRIVLHPSKTGRLRKVG